MTDNTIPELVYWSDEGGNFYGAVSRRGQGQSFYNTWYPRRAEFPTSPHEDGTPTAQPTDNTGLIEELQELAKRLEPARPYHADPVRRAAAALATKDAEIAAMRLQGQEEGFAAAVQWLRDRSAMKPPATLFHAATLLADQMEQSRKPAAALGAKP